MESEGFCQYLGRLAAIALIICTLVLAQDDAALAASASDPISINDCHVNNSRTYVSAYKPLALTFTNRRVVAADEIRFTVEYAGIKGHISDTGTFSQNIGIHHAFSAFNGSLYNGGRPKSCTVDYVHFKDGTVWTPQPSPAPTSAHH
jgi:hypothetical protein